MLVTAGGVALALGERSEAIAILVVIALNGVIGFVTEWKAERALDTLRKAAVPLAHVLRDGHQRQILAAELVPGDVVVVTADSESLIATPLHELASRLDPGSFWQVHRGTIVNVHAVQSVRRSLAGHLELKLKQRPEMLRVSSAYAHRFKHM